MVAAKVPRVISGPLGRGRMTMRTRVALVGAVLLPALTAMSWLTLTTGSTSAVEEGAGATCTADGTALAIVAYDNKFDKDCMAVPAEQAFTIELDNQDSGIPHNVSLYDTANGNKELFKGEITSGPSKITYQVPAQAAGKYEFICDPHSEFMKGTFIVG
jgi:plastocyanin